MEQKDITRLIEVLDKIELHIQDREYGVKVRRKMIEESGYTGSLDVFKIDAEALAAWTGAKRYILRAFPEVAEAYQPKQHLP